MSKIIEITILRRNPRDSESIKGRVIRVDMRGKNPKNKNLWKDVHLALEDMICEALLDMFGEEAVFGDPEEAKIA